MSTDEKRVSRFMAEKELSDALEKAADSLYRWAETQGIALTLLAKSIFHADLAIMECPAKTSVTHHLLEQHASRLRKKNDKWVIQQSLRGLPQEAQP